MRLILLPLILTCGFLGGLTGPCAEKINAAPPSQEGEVEQSITLLVGQLASAEFEIRRQAFLELWRIGADGLPALKRAKDANNAGQVEAAAALEILLRLQISPSSEAIPDELIKLLSSRPNSLGVIALCEKGYWNIAAELIAANSELLVEFQGTFGLFQLNRLIELAGQQDDPLLAWPILQLALSPEQVGWIAGKANLELPLIDSQDIDGRARQLLAIGRSAEALQLGATAPVLTMIASRSGEWHELERNEILDYLTGAPSASQFAVKAGIFELAGNSSASKAIWKKLLPEATPSAEVAETDRSEGDASPTAEGAEDTSWKRQVTEQLDAQRKNQIVLALMICGHMDQAFEILESFSPESATALHTSRSEHEYLLDSLGLERDFSNFDSWLAEQQLSLATFNRADTSHFGKLSQVCSLFVSIGYAAEAKRLLDLLTETAIAAGDHQEQLWRRELLRWMGQAEARQLVAEAAESSFESMSRDCRGAVLEGLFPDCGEVAATLLATTPDEVYGAGDSDGLTVKKPTWEPLDRLWRLDREWFGIESQSIVAAWLRRARGRMESETGYVTPQARSELTQLALGFGLTELAVELARGSSDTLNLRDLAAIYESTGDWRAAAESYSSLRYGNGTAAYVADEVEALFLAGRHDRAVALEKTRWLRPMTPYARGTNGLSYHEAANAFRELHNFARAREYFEPAYLLCDQEGYELFMIAYDYASILDELGDHQATADVRRTILLEALKLNSQIMRLLQQFYVPRGFSFLLEIAQAERLHRAVAEIQNARFDEARHHWEIAERLQPLDIETVVQCYPALVQAGRQAEADALFQRFEQNMLRHLEAWPKDSTALNNLSWMYALCDQKLDEAASLSKQAVGSAPSSATFLDTLAEVEFRRGLTSQALELMRSCIQLDPRTPHYRKQIDRFQKAIR